MPNHKAKLLNSRTTETKFRSLSSSSNHFFFSLIFVLISFVFCVCVCACCFTVISNRGHVVVLRFLFEHVDGNACHPKWFVTLICKLLQCIDSTPSIFLYVSAFIFKLICLSNTFKSLSVFLSLFVFCATVALVRRFLFVPTQLLESLIHLVSLRWNSYALSFWSKSKNDSRSIHFSNDCGMYEFALCTKLKSLWVFVTQAASGNDWCCWV